VQHSQQYRISCTSPVSTNKLLTVRYVSDLFFMRIFLLTRASYERVSYSVSISPFPLRGAIEQLLTTFRPRSVLMHTADFISGHRSRRQHEKLMGYIARFRARSTSNHSKAVEYSSTSHCRSSWKSLSQVD